MLVSNKSQVQFSQDNYEHRCFWKQPNDFAEANEDR